MRVTICAMRIEGGELFLAGLHWGIPDGEQVLLRNEKDESFPLTYHGIYGGYPGFTVRIPLYDHALYRFEHYTADQKEGALSQLGFRNRTPLTDMDSAYWDAGAYILKNHKTGIGVYKRTMKMALVCERRLEQSYKAKGREDLLAYRKWARKAKSRKKKPIWILSDRVMRAGDNGESLFRYLLENGCDKEADIYFALHPESEDFERLQRIGSVLAFGSEEHKKKFLLADKIISSGFDRWFFDLFEEDGKYLHDLYDFAFIFLQHGVLMNDLSQQLNLWMKDISLFITSSEREKKAVLDGGYGYTEAQVALTGLARFDELEDAAEKLVVVAPTWRSDIAGEVDAIHGGRAYAEDFKETDYYRDWQGLIDDQALCSLLRENGYRAEFYVHPSFIANAEDFAGNDVISVKKWANYNGLFRRGAVWITDYSSTSMDFAYLEKPVLYYQPDRETFFSHHGFEAGYFDYEEDGFGPVCETPGELVAELAAMLREKGQAAEEQRADTMDERDTPGGMAPLYKSRVEAFFAHRDRNNRKRISEALFRW